MTDTVWAPWLRVALAMGVAPEQFWRMSLKEWRALTHADDSFARSDLEALLARFPDEKV